VKLLAGGWVLLGRQDKSQFEHELHELHVWLTGQIIGFAASVPEAFAPFAAKYGDASYDLLFSAGPPPENKTSPLNQAVLALEGCCFYLHALDRALFRGADEQLRELAYDSSVRKLVRFFVDSFRNLYQDRAPQDHEVLSLIKARNAAYGLAPSLLGKELADPASALSLAANQISEAVQHPDNVLLITVIRYELLNGLTALNLDARAKAIETLL
jgi:hypothetical protein